MRSAKGVVLALAAAGKSTQAAQLAQAVHAIAPTGEDFVRVRLVPHIPDQAIFGCVEHVMQRDGELDRAQVGAEVATGARHAVEHISAQFVGQAAELATRHSAQIGGVVDGLKQSGHGHECGVVALAVSVGAGPPSRTARAGDGSESSRWRPVLGGRRPAGGGHGRARRPNP